MSKTTKRVLSMVLAVLMLLSMLPAMTFAAEEVLPFKDAYDGTVISKDALLVDMNITEAADTVIEREWDGKTYSFVVGTNAFATLTEAYAKAKELSIAKPDIIVTATTKATHWPDITAEMPSRVFAPNWNTVPMNGMSDDFVAFDWGGVAWTPNAAYTEKEVRIGNFACNVDVGDSVEIYGFTITRYIRPSEKRTNDSPDIDFLIKNARIDCIDNNSYLMRGRPNATTKNGDTLTFKNVQVVDVTDLTSGSAIRFFGDGVNHEPNLVFDGFYVDMATAKFHKKNDHLKNYSSDTSIIFKNSFLTNTAGTSDVYWSFYQYTTATADYSRKLVFDNNVMYNWNNGGQVIYNLSSTTLSGPNDITVTNNAIVNTEAEIKLFNNVNNTKSGDVKFTVTDNRYIGTTFNSFSGNDTVSNNLEFIDIALTTPVEAIQIQNVSIDSGKVAFQADNVNDRAAIYVDGTSTLKLKASDIPTGATGPSTVTKKMYSDEALTKEISEYDLSKVGDKIETIYIRVSASTGYETIYKTSVINTNVTSFNDMLAAGTAIFRGVTFGADNTAVYLPADNAAVKGNYFYGNIAGVGLKFAIDSSVVFKNTGATLPTAMNSKANIIFLAGKYGDINTLTSANATYYGANFGIDPIDSTGESVENKFDWAFSDAWDEENDTEIASLIVPAATVGSAKFDGFTVTYSIRDTARAIANAKFDFAFKNLVIDTTALYNANGTIWFSNPRMSSSTTMTDNADTFTMQNTYIKNLSGVNQMFYEPIYPTMTLDRVYMNFDETTVVRSLLGFGKIYGTFTNVQPTYTVRNCNFRHIDVGGYSLFQFDVPNGVDLTFDNNIYYSNISTNLFLKYNGTGTVTFTNNLFAPDSFNRLLHYTDATWADDSSFVGNKFIGFTEDKLTTSYLTKTTLEDTYYSPSLTGARDPDALSGTKLAAMGDNPYYLDFNMTVKSDEVEDDGTLPYLFQPDENDEMPEVLKGLTATEVVFVDTSVTTAAMEDEFGFIVRKWNGEDHIFYNTDYVNNMTDAYAAAAEMGDRPQIVILGWAENTNLNIPTASDIYTANWNTAPMKEMTADFDATATDGEDWTVNDKYLAQELVVRGLTADAAVEGNATINGVTFTQQIDLASGRTTASAPVEFVINNSRMNATDIQTNGLAGNGNTSAESTDKIIFKNFWLDKCTTDVAKKSSRFFGDNGTNMWANIEFDTAYIDFTSADFKFWHGGNAQYQYNDHAKAMAKTSSFVIKNSNIRKNDPETQCYWNISRTTYSGSDYVREVVLDNNILYNWNNEGSVLNTEKGSASAKYNYVNKMTVTNNYIYNETPRDLFRSTGSTVNQDGTTTDLEFTVTGNKLLGVNDQSFSADAIAENFYSAEALTIDEHKEVKGTQYGATGTYYLDYDMTTLNTKGSTTFNAVLNYGTVLGNVAINKDTTAVVVPENSLDGEGMYYGEFGGKLYGFKADNVNIFEMADGKIPTNAYGFENIIFPAGAYGDVTITSAANIFGSNAGINPNDKSAASAANEFEWTLNSNWDAENATVFEDIIIDKAIDGSEVVIDGVSFARYFDDTRTVEDATLDATIKNSIVDGAGNVTAYFCTDNPRATNSTVEYVNNDSLLIKDVRIVSGAANQIFDEANVPNLTVDGLYCDATAAGKRRSAIAFFKTGKNNNANIVIKNSNFRNGTDATVMAQLKGDGVYDTLEGVMTYTFDNNIVVNAGAGYFMDVRVESMSAINFTNNIIIGSSTRLVDYNGQSDANVADATVVTNTLIEGNRFIDMPATYVGIVDDLNVAPTARNNFYSSTKEALSDPTALIGEPISIGADNAYYLDFNMTVTNDDTDAEDFGAALEAGITVGDVTFTKENTAVYLPMGTGKYHKFAGKLYSFTADEVNIFANVARTASIPDGVKAFENVILPSGNYMGLTITTGQKFYGNNMGINPNDKSGACAENDFDWALNKDWDVPYGTVIGEIEIQASAAGTISFDGITVAGAVKDTARKLTSESINVTFTNVLVQGGKGGFLNLSNERAKNGRLNSGISDAAAGLANTDSFTLKNIRIGKWDGMLLTSNVEFIPANLTWDGLYYDSSVSPAVHSTNGTNYTDLGYIKSGGAIKDRSYTVVNSNLRGTGLNAGTRAILYYEGAYTPIADGFTNVFTFENNVVFNFATLGASYFGRFYTPDLSEVNVNNNTFIQTSHSGNNLFAPESVEDVTATISIDGNSFVGLASPLDVELVAGQGAPVATNTFLTSNKDAYKYGDAILGEKVVGMGEGEYYLDFNKTKKSTDGYADYTVPAGSVVYLPRSGQEYFDVDGTIYKFTANGSTIVANTNTNGNDVPNAQNVILLNGYYGEITLAKAVNILGANAGINPNAVVGMTNEAAANGFDWAFNEEWNRAYATKIDIVNIDANAAAGDITIDGIQLKKYYDDKRVGNSVVNVTFKNFIVVDGGNGGVVFTSWNEHNSLGLGNDKFELKNGRIISVNANQLLDEVNSANVTIDGLYLDAQAAGKKRTIISFFKFARQQQSKIVIKNSNFRNGVGANNLFTVSGAIDYNGVFNPATKTQFDVAYKYVAGDYITVEIADNILYNAQGANSGYLFNLGVEALYDVNITGNTIIDTKGNRMITLSHVIANSATKGSAIDGEITFDNNSIVGMENYKVDFDLGLNNNPVMTNCYYNSSIEGLNNIFANTGKPHGAMTGDYYADVARTQFVSDYTEETVATVNGNPVSDLTEALENAVEDDVITLTTDVEIEEVFVSPGVTLDLNGHKLTAEYALGYDESNIIDSNMTATSGLYIAKKALQVAENNTRLPIYDAELGCFVFANVDLSYTYYENSSYYFGPEMAAFNTVEGQRVNALLRENSADTGVEITIHLEWETGDYYSTQDYIYKPNYVEQYFSMANTDGNYYSVYFFAVFSGDALKQAPKVSVKTIVKSRGCVAESIATEFSM